MTSMADGAAPMGGAGDGRDEAGIGPDAGRTAAAGKGTEGRRVDETMRLQRFLARAGVASRRASEELIAEGRVSVNGSVVREMGFKVDPSRDLVTVDGRFVAPADRDVYLMLNKPAGVLTTMDDPQGRPCVADLVPLDRYPGLFPVGRLDKDTTGLLLFTTDGQMGQDLLHPSKNVWKTYLALVEGRVRDSELEPLRQGMIIDDGPCAPARCRLLSNNESAPVAPDGVPRGTTAVEVRIHEGRKNQVKRMLGAIGHPVLALHRSAVGPLALSGVAEGSWRHLTPLELQDLQCAVGSRDIRP